MSWKILAVIFLLGLSLRGVQLDVSPPGFNADEAALGYNAYSLIKTGKDEWGESFPLVLKSFSDYKPGLYVYLDLPFVFLLGLTELAVRLPSIILGSFSVILIYLLSKEFFRKNTISLSSAFLLAISPWHLHYSRGAWETNIATFFILLAVLSFVRALKNNRWFFLCGLSLTAAIYAYQSPRVVVPFLVLLLLIFYWRSIMVKGIIAPVILTAISLIPFVFIMTSNIGLARFQGVSIFSDSGLVNKTNRERGEHSSSDEFLAKFFHNKFISYSENFLGHYLDHFTPGFLFIDGDPLKRDKVPGMGQLYIFEIITLFAGIYFLLRKKFKNTKIIFLWLLAAPFAAALTYQTPHALRAHNMVIPLTLISGLGMGLITERFWQFKNQIRLPVFIIAAGVMLFFIAKYLDAYFVHLPKAYALEWEYGFSQVVPYILENQHKYQKIVITDRYDQPYILLLFYSRYDPAKYQMVGKQSGDNKFGFSTIIAFDKYEFRPIAKEEIGLSENTLYIGTQDEIIQDSTYPEANLFKIISYPNGISAFKIIGT